jgi:hypothetical protein
LGDLDVALKPKACELLEYRGNAERHKNQMGRGQGPRVRIKTIEEYDASLLKLEIQAKIHAAKREKVRQRGRRALKAKR